MVSRNFASNKKSTHSIESVSNKRDQPMTKKIADSKMTLQSGTSDGYAEIITKSRKKKQPIKTHTSEFRERRL